MIEAFPHGLRKILLDTNLLILLIVGLTSKDILRDRKSQRCREYRVQDFELLRGLLGAPRLVICLPNIIAESYSLIKQHRGDDGRRLRAKLIDVTASLQETYVASRDACRIRESAYLGITDPAILLGAEADDCTILTADAALHLAAMKRGVPSLNFWHLREAMLD